MNIIAIIGVALLTCFATIMVRQVKPEIAIFVSLCGGIVVLMLVINHCNDIFYTFSTIIEKAGVSNELISVVFKIVGIGYLTEFSSSICVDAGCSSLADKLTFAGKILILVVSLPIISNIINIIMEILP